jgi:hypothetical protein
MGLRPAWFQTSLRIRTDAQAGLDPCWSQTHYVGFVMAQLISFLISRLKNIHTI